MTRTPFPFVVMLLLLARPVAAADAPEANGPKTADQAVRRVVVGLSENKPIVIWEALPASYQKDVSGLVQATIAKLDPSLYNDGFAILQRTVKLLKDKKAFFLAHPLMKDNPLSKDTEKHWDAVLATFEVLLDSDLATHEKAKAIDVAKFLQGPGAKFMTKSQELIKAAAASGDSDVAAGMKMLGSLKNIKATPIKEEGDRTVLKLELEGESPAEVEFVRVEGKWIPADLAAQWKTQIEQARTELDGVAPEDLKKMKAIAVPVFDMINGTLGRLEKAQTQEQFNDVIDGLAALLGGQ